MYIIKLKIKSFKHINNFKQYLLKINNNNSFQFKNNIKLKTKNKIFTVLKSPHVNKKSREQFSFNIIKENFYISHNNLFSLINFLIIIKKIIPKNLLLNIKILKK
jgi:ribosomal protein S10